MTHTTVPLRLFTAGLALAAACGLAACGSTTAGTAAPAPATVTVTASTASAAPSTSARPTTSAPDESSSARPSRPSTAQPDTGTDAEPVDGPVEVGTVDETTALWLDTACTDLSTLLPTLLTVPTLDEATTPVDEFRTAYRDYYATVAATALQVNGNLAQLDPPSVADGAALHEGYRYYISRLADITGSGAVAIDGATDVAGIKAVVDQIRFEVGELGQEDIGLSSFSSGELQAAMRQIPSCTEFVSS